MSEDVNVNIDDRTEGDVVEASAVPVTLGTRVYKIRPAKGLKYGRRVRELAGPLIKNIGGLGQLFKVLFEKEVHKLSSDPDKAASAFAAMIGERGMDSLLDIAQTICGPGLDNYIDMMYFYCPELEADKAYIEGDEVPGEGADSKQLLTVFVLIGIFEYGPFVLTLRNVMETQSKTSVGTT